MKSNILIEGGSCNVLYLFYEKKVMQTGLGRKNWRSGFREYWGGIIQSVTVVDLLGINPPPIPSRRWYIAW